MEEHEEEFTIDDLNLVISETARAFLDLQCHERYSRYKTREMMMEASKKKTVEAKDEALKKAIECHDEYTEQIKCKVLDCGRANEKRFEIEDALFEGLIYPPVEAIKRYLRLIYGWLAGWK